MSVPSRRKLILDVDTGIDDAHAIMLALSHDDVDVIAITCAIGNVGLDDVTANTLRVLEACDRLDVPVYKGATRPLNGGVVSSAHAWNPLWPNTPVDMSLVKSEHAANALVRLAREYPGEITLFAVAPLTNVALAVNLDPAFPKNLRDVVIMGGNKDGRGNMTACAEFNFHVDPEAAYIVLNSLQNATLLPLETCLNHPLSWDFMEKWTSQGNRKSKFLQDTLGFSITERKKSRPKGYTTYDSLAMAVLLDHRVMTKSELVYATVELNGQLTRGQMVVDYNKFLKKRENILLIQEIDTPTIEQILFKIVKD